MPFDGSDFLGKTSSPPTFPPLGRGLWNRLRVLARSFLPNAPPRPDPLQDGLVVELLTAARGLIEDK